MTTALITHAAAADHITPPGHPEQVARIDAVWEACARFDLVRHTAPMGAEADVLRVHPMSHIDRLRAADPVDGIAQLDPDTWMSPGSLEAAWRGVGAVTKAVDLVIDGAATNAFCAMRPPGHHAERETPMGFCLFGNIAIGAKYALDHHGLDRVAIVDFDVHHGNGTQDLVEEDPRIRFFSSHEMPLYPGTGDPRDTGPHETVTNLALASGTSGAVFRDLYERDVFPALREFGPQLILISAGFDAHRADPLASVALETEDFGWVTDRLCGIAQEICEGRLVSALEGGYDLHALGASVAAHVSSLKEHSA